MAESKEEIKINLGHLASALRKLRNLRLMSSDYITVLTLLKYNKPTSISSKKFDSILIKAIIEEFSGIDRDVLLMALGLLQGYEREIKIGTRRKNYLKNSDYITDFYYDNRGEYEKVDSDQQKKYMASLMDIEKNRINDLADFLAGKMKRREFDEFIKDLKGYYDSDTDTTILPEPEYVKKRKKVLRLSQNSDVGDNNPHIFPDKEAENSQPEGGNEINSENKEFESLRSKNTVPKSVLTENLPRESDIAQEKSGNTEEPLTEPVLPDYDKEEKDWHEQIAESLAKMTNDLHRMKIIFTALASVLTLFLIMYFWPAKKPGTDDEIPAVTNTPLSAEASTDKGVLVEMETFSIDEDDKVIPLAPGYSRGLPIKKPEPSSADMSTLKVESSDESIVLWDKDRLCLTALDNIPEGGTHKVYVTITAKNHKEIICIEVKEFVISDDAEGPIGGGE